MEQNTVTINQLIAQILDEMRRIGYSETTIWRYYQPAMGSSGNTMCKPDRRHTAQRSRMSISA